MYFYFKVSSTFKSDWLKYWLKTSFRNALFNLFLSSNSWDPWLLPKCMAFWNELWNRKNYLFRLHFTFIRYLIYRWSESFSLKFFSDRSLRYLLIIADQILVTNSLLVDIRRKIIRYASEKNLRLEYRFRPMFTKGEIISHWMEQCANSE